MNSKDFDRLLYNDKYMKCAIEEAKKSDTENGIPIGSVIVKDGKIIGRGHNKRIQSKDPILHAELCCIQDAVKSIMDLTGSTFYTTHMPCFLCAGAIVQFGISKVVAGESQTFPHARHILENNRIEVINLDLKNCKEILKNFIVRNSNVWNNVSQNNFFKKREDVDKIFIPYKKQGYVNFYQYPPPIDTPKIKEQIMEDNLDLNKEVSEKKEFTLFVSIPYCRLKCNSCPFLKNILPSGKNAKDTLDDYLSLIVKQIKGYASTNRFSNAYCAAVYIGGGTASLLTHSQLKILLNTIKDSFNLSKNAEITLEGNPSDLNKKYLISAREIGINRLSLGLQTFNDNILKKSLNCPHNSRSGVKLIKNALKIGFNTVNIDLLYGMPNQKQTDWQKDIKKIIQIAPQSITIYRYIIHKKSASAEMIQRGLLQKQASEKEIYKLYLWARKKLIDAGYIEKRFGCFAKLGHKQRYSQLSYNLSHESIGVGAGAYSFINGYVFRTSDNVEKFKDNIDKNIFQIGDYVSIKSTKRILMERYAINNLFSGIINQAKFFNIFNERLLKVFPFIFAKFWRYNLVTISDKNIKLTILGRRYIQNMLYEFYADNFKSLIENEDNRNI